MKKIFFILSAILLTNFTFFEEGGFAVSDQVKNVYSFNVFDIDGKEVSLSAYAGKVLLIVNTASRCGFTPQYKELEELYQKYQDKGFAVLGFPANNFMGQEPGTNEEIKRFCELKYKVTFPIFSKIDVKGKNIHPLYTYLTEASPFPGGIKWNFNKFLVGPGGEVVARFESGTKPLDPEIIRKIEAALA